jgi:Calcineurin-like phosphoesterase
MRHRKFIGTIVLLSLVILACAVIFFIFIFFEFRRQTRIAEVKHFWVQMMPDKNPGVAGGRLLRAIVSEGERCPTVSEDDRVITMHRRPAPARAAFPVLLCETELRGDSLARLGNRTLPVRQIEPNDIVVIGDTGCRLVYYSKDQSCLDNDEWPFRKIAASATEKVSGRSFVLHVGDFHYREHPCADSSSRCGGSPYGDNWETWEAEFFEPADLLLRAAPWIIVRGNHENCDRAGAGWLFFFALPGQRRTDDACEDSLAGRTVSIGRTDDGRPRSLLVLDTSDEKNTYKVKVLCDDYLKALEPLDQTGSEFWVAMHQPLWKRNMNGRMDGAESKKQPCEESKSAITAIRERFETRQNERLAKLVLAGDTHAFQFFWPKTASTPIQIIAGNGGTALDTLCEVAELKVTDENCKDRSEQGDDKKYRQVKEEKRLADQTVRSFGIEGSGLTFVQQGFTVLHRDRSTWTATQFDSAGGKIVDCRFSEGLSTAASDSMPGCGPAS